MVTAAWLARRPRFTARRPGAAGRRREILSHGIDRHHHGFDVGSSGTTMPAVLITVIGVIVFTGTRDAQRLKDGGHVPAGSDRFLWRRRALSLT